MTARQKLESVSHAATVLAGAVAIGTLIFGYRQFSSTEEATRTTLTLQRENLDFDRDSKAVDLLLKYEELMRSDTPKSKHASQWGESISLAIAESIFKLQIDSDGWRETVGWIVDDHSEWIRRERLGCSTFMPEFIAFVGERLHVPREKVCK